MIANASSIVEPAFQIKNGIMKHANVSVKIIIHARTIAVEILAHVLLILQWLDVTKLCILWILYQRKWQIL